MDEIELQNLNSKKNLLLYFLWKLPEERRLRPFECSISTRMNNFGVNGTFFDMLSKMAKMEVKRQPFLPLGRGQTSIMMLQAPAVAGGAFHAHRTTALLLPSTLAQWRG